MQKILVIDNYDSFTYNLVHYLEGLDREVTVLRNDEADTEDVLSFNKILLSPGPGVPDEAGNLKEIIRACAKTKSILGICLGQQAIAEVFGGSLINLPQVHHGVSAPINLTVSDEPLFENIPQPIMVGRYHSWCANTVDLPPELEATSIDANGNIMSLRHRFLDVKGVQFHPESVLTPHGKQILRNWINT